MLLYLNQIFLVFPSGAAAVVARFADLLLAARPRSALQVQSAKIPTFGGFMPHKGRQQDQASPRRSNRCLSSLRLAFAFCCLAAQNLNQRLGLQCSGCAFQLNNQRQCFDAFIRSRTGCAHKAAYLSAQSCASLSFARLRRENTRQAAIYAHKCPPHCFAYLCKSRGRRYQPLAASSCAKARHIENLIVLPAGRQPAAVPQCCAITQLIASLKTTILRSSKAYGKHFRAGSACEKFLDSR